MLRAYTMQTEKQPVNYPRKIARIFLKTILYLVLFVLVVFLLLLTPPVQRIMTGKVENYLQNKLKTRVEIGRISFGLSGKVGLDNVYIEDRSKDTLISGGSLKAHINFLKLFSNEVVVKDLELQNITAKIKRTLPDTVFNFQFIADAFATQQKANPDTAATAPMKLDISNLTLDNIRLTYNDVVSGSDVFAHIGNLSATIDTLDPYVQHFDIPTLIARNVQASVKQVKPLFVAEPMSKEVQDAVTPLAMKLSIGQVDLSKINIQFSNDVSAFYTTANIGQLKSSERLLDLQNNKVWLNELALNNSKVAIRLGNKPEARVVEKEVEQEVDAQQQAGWDFRVARLTLNNNALEFDNDNSPRLSYGMDYAHLKGDSLTLHVNDFVLNNDSVYGKIVQGAVRERSGFDLDALEGEVLFGPQQAYLKGLLIRTPGSEIKRDLVLDYDSKDALSTNFPATHMDVAITDTRIQVKDILTFAPQLRSNPALANPSDTWYLNLVGNGTANQLRIEDLRFDGLRNTQINAHGTLAGLMDPKQAGGAFTIERLHTTQTDLALFTGQRLSNASVNLPEEFNISGTIRGNAGQLNTDLDVATSMGNIAVDGSFANLTNPAALSYNATVRTRGLRLGTILRQPGTIGTLTGSFRLNGRGATPQAINTRFTGDIASVGYNRYQYSNVHVTGSLVRDVFNVNVDSRDPNADLNLTASGTLNDNPSFRINGMIDSLKTGPLNLTPDPMTFHGRINGTVANLKAEVMDADVMITEALLVHQGQRVPMDTVHLQSGRADTGNYIRLRSDVANAAITGEFRLADLGAIIQDNTQPYFATSTSAHQARVAPYDFRFNADVIYSPVLASFVPGLTSMEPLHAEGRFITGQGMNAVVRSDGLVMGTNTIQNLNLTAQTTATGLQVQGNIGRIMSGSSFDIYNAHVNATALNNNIDFNLGVDDPGGKNKYYLSGILRQPSAGTYALQLRPDSLLLNYDRWSISPNNQLTITPNGIQANDFVLQQGNQRLSINSLSPGSNSPLRIDFNDFRVATITGFIKADSLLVDGRVNGQVTLENPMQQMAFTSNLTIADLSLRQDTIGNVNLQVSTAGSNRYNVNSTITGRGNDVALTGSFAPSAAGMDLDLDLDVRTLQLNTLEGAMASAITNASGAINGRVSINGTTAKPDIDGKLNFDQASFSLTMLGSQFRINNESLQVTNDGLAFDNFTIRDSSDNALNIDGTVLTSNFINYNFDLDVRADKFELLNSTKAKNKLYYGKLNVTSNLHIAGTEVRPVVDGNVNVNDGTNLFVAVPQAEPGVVQREGVVEFVDMDAPGLDSLFRTAMDTLNNAGVKGMDIAVNITVSKEAILNVIVDQANGDFLNVRGEAQLSTGIDPSGKITMVGNYVLEEGAYQLSFNFIQRKFNIQRGSTITWTGEPTTAQLNVTAVYVANTAPLDLVADQITDANTARNTYLQKLPFEVRLNLTGELLKPVIAFDIVLPQDKNYGVSNDIVAVSQLRLDQIRQDEGELNKQVFSLLLLGRFVGENPFKSQSGGGFSAGTYARQSVSRLLTEQLNNLAGGLIGGVDIDFDVQSTEDYTTGDRRNRTDLNVGLSKRLLNDRLKVSVGSNFQLEGPQNTNQQSSNIAGNIAMEYQLSRDGRYLLRFYRSNEYEGVVDGYIIETGVGFIFSVDYNRFSQLFGRRKQRTANSGTTTQNASGK